MDLLKNLSILVAERNEEEVDFVLLDEDSQFGAWVTSPTLIQGTGVYVRSATFGYLNEENEFEADWCGTILYDQADDAAKYIYYEQDDVRITLHNYMNMLAIAAERPASISA